MVFEEFTTDGANDWAPASIPFVLSPPQGTETIDLFNCTDSSVTIAGADVELPGKDSPDNPGPGEGELDISSNPGDCVHHYAWEGSGDPTMVIKPKQSSGENCSDENP